MSWKETRDGETVPAGGLGAGRPGAAPPSIGADAGPMIRLPALLPFLAVRCNRRFVVIRRQTCEAVVIFSRFGGEPDAPRIALSGNWSLRVPCDLVVPDAGLLTEQVLAGRLELQIGAAFMTLESVVVDRICEPGTELAATALQREHDWGVTHSI
jgi:hypothetical protein